VANTKKWHARSLFCWWQAMRFCHMVVDKWPIQKVARGRPVFLVAGRAVLSYGQYKQWRGLLCWWQAMRFCHMVADMWPIQKVARVALLVTGRAVLSYGG
jgi:hypothetical protein